MSNLNLTRNQVAVLMAMNAADFRTPGALMRDGGLDPRLTADTVHRCAVSLTDRGLAVRGAAGGIARNAGYRMTPAGFHLAAAIGAARDEAAGVEPWTEEEPPW